MTPHFSKHELACSHCGKINISQPFLDKLESLRLLFGKSLRITSGYRCPEYDLTFSGAGNHVGHAVDLLPYDPYDLNTLIPLAISLTYKSSPAFTGIGLNLKKPISSRFLHLDDKHPTRTFWHY